MTAATTTAGVRALLADGRIVTIRPLVPGDAQRLLRLHENLPERDRYLRFFSPYLPPRLDRLVAHMVTAGDAHRLGIGAFLGDHLVGVANFEVLADPTEAEVALAVDHSQQAHGVGTLLLEHLASAARGRGVRWFTAEVLAENSAMLRVFRDAGLAAATGRIRAGPAGCRRGRSSCAVPSPLRWPVAWRAGAADDRPGPGASRRDRR